MKRWRMMLIGMLLCAVLVVGLGTAGITAAKADTETVGEIEYTYEVYGDEVTLEKVGSLPESGELSIPATLGGKPVTTIGYGSEVISSQNDLKILKIPDSVISIDDYAFEDCRNLTEVSLPGNLDSIGKLAFANCTSLNSVQIPAKVTSIGAQAFQNCQQLTGVYIPSKVTNIGNKAFYVCWSLEAINVAEDNKYYSSEDGILFSEDKKILYAYPQAKEATSYTIPDSVISIEKYAFCYCIYLKDIIIPGHVSSIGEKAFCGCESLTSIFLPPSVTSIGHNAFQGCSGLQDVYVPTGLDVSDADISADANIHQYNKESNGLLWMLEGETLTILSSGDMPDFSDRIYQPWIDSREDIKSVVLTRGVTHIGNHAFHIVYLSSVTIPNGVTSIGDHAFQSCNSLASVTIPEGVTSIGDSAFYNSGLESIHLPASLNDLGELAFADCGQLRSITVNSSNTNYMAADGVLYDYAQTKLIQYPSGNLETFFTIPNKVLSIGTSAFEFSKLKTIIIPPDVREIGKKAFAYSNSLAQIVSFPITPPVLGADALHSIKNTAQFLVRSSDYKTASEWSARKDQMTVISTVTAGTGVTFTGTAAITYNNVDYYAEGAEITLAPNPPAGYGDLIGYQVLDSAGKDITADVTLNGNKLTMPAQDITVTASFKAIPTVDTPPEASEITYGQALSDSTLSNWVVTAGKTTVAGKFAWKTPDTKPAVADSGNTEYEVEFTPTDSGNYMPVTCKIKLTVKPKQVTVTAASQEWTYDGQAHSNNAVTGDDLLTGDTLAASAGGSVMNVSDTQDGNNPVSACQILRGKDDVTANYAITKVPGTLKINPRDVTLTSESGEKAYDGKTLTKPDVKVSGSGFVDGEVSGIQATGSVTNVAEGEITNAITWTGNTAFKEENYAITRTEGILKITAAPVTVKAQDKSFVYNGTAQSWPEYDVTGLVGEDAITAVVTGSITFPKDSPVTNKVESYTFTKGDAKNYDVKTADGKLTMTNAAAAITITAASGQWTYDGAAHADSAVTVTEGTLFQGDTLNATATGSVTNVADTADGNNPIATGYQVKHGDTDVTANYVITPVAGTLKINPASVTITAQDKAFAYNGTAQSWPEADVSGLVGEDAIKATVTGSITRPEESPVVNRVESYTFTKGDEKNYSVKTVDGTLTMTNATAAITITAASGQWTYDGAAHTDSAVTVTEGALFPGDTLNATATGSVTNVADTAKGNNPIAVGYSVTHGNADVTANYAITPVAGTLKINPRDVTLTSESGEKTYDGTALTKPDVKVSGTGFVDGEVSGIQATGSVTNVAEGEITNTITWTGNTAYKEGNYAITKTEGILKITTAPVTVTAQDKAFVYNGTAQSWSEYEVTGLIGEDVITAVVTGSITFPKDSPVTNKVESYTFTKGDAKNYDVKTADGTLTMTNAAEAITITAADGEWTYDGQAHSNSAVTVTEGALFPGDTLNAIATGSVTNVADTAKGNNPIAVGYSVTHGNADVTANYAITPVAGTLTITRKSVTVTAKDQTIREGEEIAAGPEQAELAGAVKGHLLEAVTLAAGEGEIIPSAAKISDAEHRDVTDNYEITCVPGKLTVIAKISATVTFKVVNGAWGDGTREPRAIILSGYEGDELRLRVDDVPDVGNHPDAGYTMGSWDTEPSVYDAEYDLTSGDPITADTIYTYTYAKAETPPPESTTPPPESTTPPPESTTPPPESTTPPPVETEPPVEYCTVRFDANGGTGTMEDLKVEKDSAITLPKCGFDAPAGKMFDKWDKGEAGEQITITEDIVVKALWKKIPVRSGLVVTAKMVSGGKTSLKFTWSLVKEAEGYDVYFAPCERDEYGKTITTVSGVGPRSVTFNGLETGKHYKAYVRAWVKADGVKHFIGDQSPTVHAIPGGVSGSDANAKAVKVKESKVKVQIGGTHTIQATVTSVSDTLPAISHGGMLRYYSSNLNIATVKNGVVTGKAAGSCTIIVMASNGATAKVKVTVTREQPQEPEATIVTQDGGVYRLNAKKTVAILTGAEDQNISKLTIPATVKIGEKSYPVTEIADGACRDLPRLKTLVIGKNVEKIGKKAFHNCGKLTAVTIRTEKLKKDAIGDQAFGNGAKKPTVKCAEGLVKKYAKWLKAKGMSKDAVFKAK